MRRGRHRTGPLVGESERGVTSTPMISETLARRLDEALLARREIAPLTQEQELDLQTAYHVQERGIELRQQRGEKIVGYKMGLTSAAKRAQMNLAQPIYGVLTDAMEARGQLK